MSPERAEFDMCPPELHPCGPCQLAGRGCCVSEPVTAEEARQDHFAFTIDRHETAPLADRIWHLRHQYTSDDAAYLALAEALEAPLYACDAKLDGGSHDTTIRLINQSR